MTDRSPPPPQTPNPSPSGTTPHAVAPQVVQIPPQILAQIIAAQQRGVMPNLGQQILMNTPAIQFPMVAAQVQQSMQSWQGPYPPPDAVERYEKILPGTFDRLISMAEQLQVAQIEDTKRVQDMTHADQKRGNYLGFATTGLAMAGAVGCVLLGAEWIAGAFLSVPVLAVARAFIESARSNSVPQMPEVQPPVPTEPQTTAVPAQQAQ